jgi:IS5 family transposase
MAISCALILFHANKKNDEKLGQQNNKVLHRAYRNTPLTDRQKQENKQRSSIRYIVERTFGLVYKNKTRLLHNS